MNVFPYNTTTWVKISISQQALQTLASSKHIKSVPAKHWNHPARCQALNHWKNLSTSLYCQDEMHFLFLELVIPKSCLNNLSLVLQAMSNPLSPKFAVPNSHLLNLFTEALTGELLGPLLPWNLTHLFLKTKEPNINRNRKICNSLPYLIGSFTIKVML